MLIAFRRHPYLTSAFALAALLALFFAVRVAVGLVYWSTHENEPVRAWMTVGYIARSWDLDPREIDAAAGLPPPRGHPLTLAEIASDRGVPVSAVIAEVEAALTELRSREGPSE